MNTYHPTETTAKLVNANKRMLGARLRLEQAKEIMVSAELQIKRLEASHEFQGMEDREYVSRALSIRADVIERECSKARGRTRIYKKQLREI